jgi:hydrogenase nickel incorporation protein HypB
MTDILDKNDQIAQETKMLLSKETIFTVNLLGSPGAGKTSLLEQTIAALRPELKIAVIEGDLFTAKDAKRIERYDVPVIQINTGGGCHLNAAMVNKAVATLNLAELDLLIIENVGNLVCPAEFNLGEDAKVTVLSISEGEDKPLKYPLIFKESAAVLLNKIDLLPYTPYNLAGTIEDLTSINPSITVIQASCRTGEGLATWYDWLRQQVGRKKAGGSNVSFGTIRNGN